MLRISLRPLSLAVTAVLSFSPLVHADTSDTDTDDTVTLPELTVEASADASADGLPQDYAGHQVARGGRVGFLGNGDYMDTPFNATAYTSELMQDQQARSVSDVLQNDPAVRTARGYGNFQELYVVRGFPVYSDDMAYNGLYGLLPRQYVATEFLERVEVLNGANSFLNGAAPGGSGVGGSINLVPKRAPNDPLTRLTFGFESDGQASIGADVARRFGDQGQFGIRVNTARHNGDTSVDDEGRELDMFSVGLDYRGESLRLSLDAGYQNHEIDAPRPSVTPSGGIPDASDASDNFAQPWTYSRERESFGTFRAEYDLNPQVTAWVAAGMRKGKESNRLANPTSDADGNLTSYRYDNVREDRVHTGEVGVRGTLDTFGISHQWAVTAATYSLESRNAYAMSDYINGFTSNLYSPVDVDMPDADYWVSGSLSSPQVTARTNTTSVAFADTLGFANDRVLVTLGARYQTIAARSYDYDTGVRDSDYDDDAVTPLVGVVYKATDQLSLYANYAEALVQGDTAPSTSGGQVVTNVGEMLEPYVAKQVEVGLKYDGGQLGGTLALFSTRKPFGMVRNGVFSDGGEQRNRGVELSMFGQLTPRVRLLGGVTLLDAELVDTVNGTNDGNDAIGVPHVQANLGAEWDVPGVPGLVLGGRVVYTGRQYADAENELEIPDWTRLDLTGRYVTMIANKVVTFRGKIENVADRDYWASAGGYPDAGYLVLGNPRTFTLSASIDF